jgi:ABC-type proline/glycine betaine transport system permease subunit
MTTWRLRIACWIPKAKNTHSEYVIIIAFPLQQWLHRSASILRYTYIAFIVIAVIDQWQQVL